MILPRLHGRTRESSKKFFLLLVTALASGCQDNASSATNFSASSSQANPIDSPAPSKESPVPSVTPSPSPTAVSQAPGTLDTNCMANPDYDACIFYKNPVAQGQAPLSPSLSPTSNLTSLQIYGVKLKGLSGTGLLENSTYTVTPGSGMTRVRKNTSGDWKYAFSSNCKGSTCTADSSHKVGQLMAYFWLNHQLEYMSAQTGQFYAKGKDITVETYSPDLDNAYWDGSSIIMGDGGSSNAEFALGAEVYLHEAGHANLYFAATGTIGGSSRCGSAKGCIGGINEGQADYHAAIIFPENGAPLGETAMNDPEGLTECGLSRGLAANKNTTAQMAYKACSSQPGEVHLMGRVYASVWWEVRNKSGNDPGEVDQLFTEHLKSLQNSDNFETALTKIKTVDKALFKAKYSADFTEEFKRRGI